ncbi:ChaB family protein [Rhizobium laguerreae]|uniref:ChaB family protein n=1 Tax=Rhizobium laguerreae TaxID=1076926 RepID=UPI0035E459E2
MLRSLQARCAPQLYGRSTDVTRWRSGEYFAAYSRPQFASVRKREPSAAIRPREAFNHAFKAHAGDPRQEEAAHRMAWAAVKRSYVKIGDTWTSR